MNDDRIQPRTLKGFRDFLPEQMRAREFLVDTAKQVCQAYGYVPIDTPALEYSEILLGKGGDESDKQLFRFEDQGGRDVAMRFDLTVPLARFMAGHVGELGVPFKRYHTGLVWRGERPQRGRYREFLQFDFDTIGTESVVADIETGLLIHDLFEAFGFESFTVRFNNRRLLTGVLERLGVADRSGTILRSMDRLAKIGEEAVADELSGGAGLSSTQAAELVGVLGLTGTSREVLVRLEEVVGDSAAGRKGVEELTDYVAGIEAAGIDEARMRLDLSIARGLDYYTGTVYETFLDDLDEIGSVCSGGRYDDLASLYTKERIPGVGASLGVDRLLAAMDALGTSEGRATQADVLVVLFDPAHQADYVRIAASLRTAGVGVELYPEARKLGAQLKYADRRGHRLAVIIGVEEWERGSAQIKDLRSGESVDVGQSGLEEAVVRMLDERSPA